MTTVFIAGSISINHLHATVEERINNIVSSGFHIVVGDADGADTSIQECLAKVQARKVTVYCTGNAPRNNVASWPIHKVTSKAKSGSRAYYTAKDLEMARRSDYGLMVWDGKSTGTLSNVIELLREKKKSVIFINQRTCFVTVSDGASLDQLLAHMSNHARDKAEQKIGLSLFVAGLRKEQRVFDSPSLARVAQIDMLEAEASAPSDLMVREPAPFGSTKEDGSSDPAPNIAASVENLKLRTTLIFALKEHIARAHLNQSQAARALGVTQRRLSDLHRERVELFGLDALVDMAAAAGLRLEMKVRDTNAPPQPSSGT
jgi:predicted XRE-type DNA-binding protein